MSVFRVRGDATSEDIAAITAVLAARLRGAPAEDAYTRWRRTRLAALRAASDVDRPRA